MEEEIQTPPIFGEAVNAVRRGGEGVHVSGLWGSSRALFLWELARSLSRPLLVLSATTKESRALFGDYSFFAESLGVPAVPHAFFPPLDVLPYDVVAPDPAVVAERLKLLGGISSGFVRVCFSPVKAAMLRLPPPSSLVGEASVIKLAAGSETGHAGLVERLDRMGYRRAAMVYEPGEFSVRGGILDLFTAGLDAPVRLEFFGDTVESIREFDPDTQRSTRTLDSLTVMPAREPGPDSRAGLSSDLPAYFGEPPLVVLDEPGRVWSRAAEFEERCFSSYMDARNQEGLTPPEGIYVESGELKSRMEALGLVLLESLPMQARAAGPAGFHYETRSMEAMRLRDQVPRDWPEELPKTPVSVFCMNLLGLLPGRAVNVVSHTQGQASRLMEIFVENGVPATQGPPLISPEGPGKNPARVSVGGLSSGFLMDGPGLAFVTSRDIFGEKPKHAPAPRAKVERFLTSLSELSEGDFVVHVEHGIGRYQGLRRLKLLGVESDFLDVVYQESDRLYVPVDELGKLQKYIGGEAAQPKLDRLGGTSWERAKSRAKKAVEEMAKELLELYAARAVAPGRACSPDDNFMRELEASFEYEETPDQAEAIREVKADLEEPHPMDRLVCGDVGYGKTEVAVRAAFKAALDGRQTAVLVPTTLLASQHFETFSERLAAFPVKVGMLSRFRSRQQQKETVEGLKSGAVDIVIGTHRLLAKDVEFHDLGLLVIDEEHRFGVRHKERLKAMRKQVDVLTLTATPIPRTLHMSVSGIRDLSIIETPPPDRQPIKTIVTRFDRTVIRDAVLREMERGGQVFFVHNRIESIYRIGDFLKEAVPGARIGVAHGRMREDLLEDVMAEFISGKHDILLTTAIIESGLDIPAANTIIINRADRFGLADLYQLRGRVGRSRARAYAYLLVPGEEGLTDAAQKRLRVLGELTGLGSGFRLALHDLEIRGAGNILGPEQSGHISAVGFDLYTQMLEEAVSKLRGEEVETVVDTAMDLKVSAYIPEGYVPDTAHRLGIYKRLAGASTGAEVADLEAELSDRYGPVPEPTRRLVGLMELKVLARGLKAAAISLLPSEVRITFSPAVDIAPDKLLDFLGKRRGTARYVPPYTLFIKRPHPGRGDWEALFGLIKNCLKELA